ncbi:MAG TPA: hypothetical protein VHB53_02095 [Solirubrobacterales bacterium]|nr:hypothetical protein [Solirubrobacterales bacterium]
MYRTGPIVGLLCATLALAACGGGGSNTQAAHTTKEKTVAAKELKSAATGPHAAGGCQARLGDFLDRMDDLRQALIAGLSYDEYVVRVRAIRDAYEAVPIDKLGIGCVTGAASHAEDAFNQYLRAANAWGECAATAGCAASEVEGKLQRRWRMASKSLGAVERKSG